MSTKSLILFPSKWWDTNFLFLKSRAAHSVSVVMKRMVWKKGLCLPKLGQGIVATASCLLFPVHSGNQLPYPEGTCCSMGGWEVARACSTTWWSHLSGASLSQAFRWLQPWLTLWLQPQERPWAGTTQLSHSWILTQRNYEIIDACHFNLLNSVVIWLLTNRYLMDMFLS